MSGEEIKYLAFLRQSMGLFPGHLRPGKDRDGGRPIPSFRKPGWGEVVTEQLGEDMTQVSPQTPSPWAESGLGQRGLSCRVSA